MVDGFLDLMLGNFRMISTFYFQHQTLFNALIVGAAVYRLFFLRTTRLAAKRAGKDRKEGEDESTQSLRGEGHPL
ncbi:MULTISPECIES: hypothetical protein [Sediminibacillus]|uniref:hypothetical protein n=1 Tax=Sediminibacillus TaxID=482460 RepID=UPI00042290E7|nr:hypothetical protein [Sediminibacillus terrae]